MQIEIPGFDYLHLKAICTDYTGTLALKGELIDGVKGAVSSTRSCTHKSPSHVRFRVQCSDL
jgi:hypothetical protein